MIWWKELIRRAYFKYSYTYHDYPLPSPEGVITRLEVKEAIVKHYTGRNLFLSDPGYISTTKKEAQKFSKLANVHNTPYVEHIHDCDNYSAALKGHWADSLISYSFGIAWSQTHAFNIFIDNKRKVWFVEPQGNIWYPIEKAKKIKKYWPLRMVLI